MKKIRGWRIFYHPDNILIAWKEIEEDMLFEGL